MGNGFRRSVFRLTLLLWFTLMGSNIHAAETSASASASVVPSAGVASVTTDYWNDTSRYGASVGRVNLRIAGAGLYIEPSGDLADTIGYFSAPGNIRLISSILAARIRFIAETGMLSGRIATSLLISGLDTTGPIIMAIAYN
jgi:hypothetical protein